jgi:hypothetical protein
MIVVKLYACRRFLPQSQFCACFIPETVAVGKYLGGYHAVKHHHTVGSHDRQDFRHDVLQTAPVPADENGIRTRKSGDVRGKEVTDMYANAWRTKATGILLDDGFAFRPDLEGFYLNMGK